MKPSRQFVTLAIGWISLTATAAFAGPYQNGTGARAAGIAAVAPKKTCETILANRAYDCVVKSSFDTEFTDCFTFTSPGTISAHFDLFPTGLGATLGCSCDPSGSLKKPKFDQSKRFDCVGDTVGGQFVFAGKVSGNGKKITGGHDASSIGDTFKYTCVLRTAPCP